MKKIIYISTLTIFFATATAMADSYMPLPDAVNSRMFSTEGSAPLMNLERNYYTNQAIMKIEEKQTPKREEKIKDTSPRKDTSEEKSGFKDLFKGFVIEY